MSNNAKLLKAMLGDHNFKKAGLINKKQGLPPSVGLGSMFSNNMKGRSGKNSIKREKDRKDVKNLYNKFNPPKKNIDYYIKKNNRIGIPLMANNVDTGDRFGLSVSISDNWAIVGAHREDSNPDGSNQTGRQNSGAAYIYKKKLDETWEEVVMLKSSATWYDDSFGYAVAITDNWAIVGAQNDDSNADGSNLSGASNSGAAYIFKKNDNGTWGTQNDKVYNQTYTLKASNADSSDKLGFSVSITDNWAIVGAYSEDSNADGSNQSGAIDSGAAYIFKNVDGTWGTQNGIVYNQTYILKAGNASSGDYFGYAVAITDKWAIVGAYLEDSNADGSDQSGVSGSGATYIFKNNNGTWGTQNGSVYNEAQILKASNPGGGDRFGLSVNIADNWAIVGAFREDSNADGTIEFSNNTDVGAAYIFKNNNGTWGTLNGSVYNETYILKASNAGATDFFGFAVSITDNWAIVGGHLEDSDDTNSGAAYIFKNNNGTWGTQNGSVYNETQMLKGNHNSNKTASINAMYFGFSVYITDNLVIVGAPRSNVESGSAFVFNKLLNDGIWRGSTKMLKSDVAVVYK